MQCSDLKFTIDVPWKEAFGSPTNWGRCLSSAAFVTVRIAFFLTWAGITIWSIADHYGNAEEENAEYWVYLTHWSLLFELVYFAFAALVSVLSQIASIPNGVRDQTPWFARLTYGLQSATYVITFFVCVLYWALVYDGGTVTGLAVVTHGLNFVLAFVDFLIAGIPLKYAHVCTPLLHVGPFGMLCRSHVCLLVYVLLRRCSSPLLSA